MTEKRAPSLSGRGLSDSLRKALLRIGIAGAVVAALAVGVDGGRAFMAKAKLDQGVEAAAVAVATQEGLDPGDDPHFAALPAFSGYFPPGLMGAQPKPLRLATGANGQIEIIGEAVMPTRFLGLIGIHQITLSSSRWVLPSDVEQVAAGVSPG